MMLRDGEFRKASGSETGGCVEVAADRDGVRIRDSKRPDGDVLSCADGQWHAFIKQVKDGAYDLPA
jgi:hypothetical protein